MISADSAGAGKDENTEEAQSSDGNYSHPRSDFWKTTDELHPAADQNADRNEESYRGQEYSLQRTQLFTNGSIGFAPLWSKGSLKANDSTNAYEAGVWKLFEVLECSGLQQFNMNTDLRLGSKNLFGGRDDIAEGASYRICTRLMPAKSEPKFVAVKVIKGSLLQLQSKSKEQAAASRLHTIWKDVGIMTRQQYRRMHGHPHVMTCLGYGWDVIHSGLSVFVVVPLAERGTLRQFLLTDEVSHPMKKEIFKQVCLGLRSLHRYDIAHGDIKMENVLVFNRPHLQTEEGRREYEKARKEHPQVPPIWENVNVRLSDFGCSLTLPDDTYTGTTAYNAPEARNGEVNKTADDGTMTKFIKCDIFSCGLLFLEILLNGGSIASHGDVQSMILDEGELPVLHFARKIALDITNDRRWGQRGGAIARDCWNNIFNATLRFDPHQRYFVDYILNEIEKATWR
jgi:serine/threonine protein kinase